MKTGPDKAELRIRRSHYGPLEWSLAAPPPSTIKRFRRWNLVLIALLLFLVLGVFVVAEAPTTGGGASNSANASWKEGESPIHRAQPGIHNRGGSGGFNKDLKSSHHAS